MYDLAVSTYRALASPRYSVSPSRAGEVEAPGLEGRELAAAFAGFVNGYKQAVADRERGHDQPMQEVYADLEAAERAVYQPVGCQTCEHPAAVHTEGGCGVIGCKCTRYRKYDPAEGRPQGPADAFNPSTNHRAQRADGTHERHRGRRVDCRLCNERADQ